MNWILLKHGPKQIALILVYFWTTYEFLWLPDPDPSYGWSWIRSFSETGTKHELDPSQAWSQKIALLLFYFWSIYEVLGIPDPDPFYGWSGIRSFSGPGTEHEPDPSQFWSQKQLFWFCFTFDLHTKSYAFQIRIFYMVWAGSDHSQSQNMNWIILKHGVKKIALILGYFWSTYEVQWQPD